MGAWRGLFVPARLYSSVTDEVKDLDPFNRSAMVLAGVLDDIRQCFQPVQVMHTCTGAVDKVAHSLGSLPDHVAIGSLDVKVADGGHGGVTIIKWDATIVEVQGVAGNQVRLLVYRYSKYM